MSSKGADYSKERTIKQGRPFTQVVTIADSDPIATVATIRPEDHNFVLYITEIFIQVNVEPATDWEVSISSPANTFFTAPADDTGIALASLINKDISRIAGTTGVVHTGIYEVPSLIPAYFWQKDSFESAAVGGDGAWDVKLIGVASDGTDNVATTITFKGVEVRKKSV